MFVILSRSVVSQISLVVAGPNKKLVEGSDVQILCLTEANPPEVTYRWFVNDQFAPDEVSPELWLPNITRRLHNSLVRCEAQNAVEKTEESKALSISCEYLHNIITILAEDVSRCKYEYTLDREHIPIPMCRAVFINLAPPGI